MLFFVIVLRIADK